MKEKNTNKQWLAVIIIAIIFGLAAGATGELLARTYLFSDFLTVPLFGSVDIRNSQNGQNIVIQGARKVVVEQETKIEETINSVNSSIVGIFKKIDQIETDNFMIANNYNLQAKIGQAIIVTSDGWLLSNSLPRYLNSTQAAQGYVIIDNNKKVYSIDKSVYDAATGFYFIHISDAKDLPVKEFSSKDNINKGEIVLAISWRSGALVDYLSEINSGNVIIKSSDSLYDKINLTQVLDEKYKGAVIVDLGGKVVGLVNDDLQIEPMYHFTNVVKSVLENNEVARPKLGINYIELYNFSGNKDLAKGIMITKDTRGAAFIEGSSLQEIGLEVGDIITRIGNQDIDESSDLIGILSNYKSGDVVTIKYQRQETDEEVIIKL